MSKKNIEKWSPGGPRIDLKLLIIHQKCSKHDKNTSNYLKIERSTFWWFFACPKHFVFDDLGWFGVPKGRVGGMSHLAVKGTSRRVETLLSGGCLQWCNHCSVLGQQLHASSGMCIPAADFSAYSSCRPPHFLILKFEIWVLRFEVSTFKCEAGNSESWYRERSGRIWKSLFTECLKSKWAWWGLEISEKEHFLRFVFNPNGHDNVWKGMKSSFLQNI